MDIPYDEWLAKHALVDLHPYYEWLAGHITATVKRAADNLQPATLRVGRAPVQIGYNRRLIKDGKWIGMGPNPNGAIVPWVDVLGVYGEDGKRIAVLFSHAAHPVMIMDFDHRTSHVHTVIGPDYPGYAVKHLRKLLSEEGVFMFAQGCGANINAYPRPGGFEACDAAGLSLAFAVTQALANAKNVASASLEVRSLCLSLPLQRLSVTECKEWLSEHPNNKNIKRLLAKAESGQTEGPPIPYPMRAFAVGDDLCILTLSHETVAEYQLFADEKSPFKHTLVFGYTNGHIGDVTGYVATKKGIEEGGYEAGPRFRWPLDPSTEQLIQEGITNLLTDSDFNPTALPTSP